eukprot:gene26705-biopygen17194
MSRGGCSRLKSSWNRSCRSRIFGDQTPYPR